MKLTSLIPVMFPGNLRNAGVCASRRGGAFFQRKQRGEFLKPRRKIARFIQKRENRPIRVPLIGAIISVPHPMPTNFLKKQSDIITLVASSDKSTPVFNAESFTLYRSETAFTKKSYTCGYR